MSDPLIVSEGETKLVEAKLEPTKERKEIQTLRLSKLELLSQFPQPLKKLVNITKIKLAWPLKVLYLLYIKFSSN